MSDIEQYLTCVSGERKSIVLRKYESIMQLRTLRPNARGVGGNE
jgi:hypothetical protein